MNLKNVANLSLNTLLSQTNYVVFVVIKNPFGSSPVYSHQFKTLSLGFGIRIKIPLSTNQTNSVIKTALSKTMRISEQRIIPLTSENTVNQAVSSYNPSIMVLPTYYYEFAITPDQNKAELLPIFYYQLLITE